MEPSLGGGAVDVNAVYGIAHQGEAPSLLIFIVSSGFKMSVISYDFVCRRGYPLYICKGLTQGEESGFEFDSLSRIVPKYMKLY